MFLAPNEDSMRKVEKSLRADIGVFPYFYKLDEMKRALLSILLRDVENFINK